MAVSDKPPDAEVLVFPAPPKHNPLPDDALVFFHAGDRWRVPDVERLRAEADTKRIADKIAARNRL